MTQSYRVRLEKMRHVFCAAHFITYGNDICEPLHGHNYHVAVELCGALNENHYVVDFVAAGEALDAILGRLDHRMLLPTKHPTIRVEQSGGEVLVTHGDRRWVFPESDCVLLPMANTTAERLAEFLGQQLLDELEKRNADRPASIEVAVDECDGQWGVFTQDDR